MNDDIPVPDAGADAVPDAVPNADVTAAEVTAASIAPAATEPATETEAVAPAAAEAVAPAPVEVAPAPAEAAATPRRSRRRILVISLVSLGVLIVAGLGITYALLSAQYAPSTSVSAFLDQVVKGRSAEAVKLMSPKPAGNAALVNDDVYSGAKHRVTSYKIESTQVHGDHALVTARLRTDSGSWTQRFDLVGTKHMLLWNIWTVDGHDVPRITLADDRPTGVTVDANGVPVQKDHSGYNDYYALPGSYDFAVESDNSLVAADSHSASVRSFTSGTVVKVQLSFHLTDDGIAAGRAAVDQFLDGCLAQATLAPTGDCGFYVENEPTGTISDILWSITRRPVVSFGDWADNGWLVKTDTAGVFEMDGRYTGSLGRGDVSALFTSYDVQGYVDLQDGKVTFHSTYSDGDGGQPGSGA